MKFREYGILDVVVVCVALGVVFWVVSVVIVFISGFYGWFYILWLFK